LDTGFCAGDVQLAIIKTFAAPLNSHQRGPFLERVAVLLRGQENLGDGTVHRCAQIAQAEFGRLPAQIDGRR